jgi:hypothetical protein
LCEIRVRNAQDRVGAPLADLFGCLNQA